MRSTQRPQTLKRYGCGAGRFTARVRSATSLYVRYTTGEEELYDEIADPFELSNLVDDPDAASQLAAMRGRAQELCTQGSIYPPDWPFATDP